MSRFKRFVKRITHPLVIAIALIILVPIGFLINGPGFRYVLPKLLRNNDLVGVDAVFVIEGSILGGFTIKDLTGSFNHPSESISFDFEADVLEPNINYFHLVRPRSLAWIKGVMGRGMKFELLDIPNEGQGGIAVGPSINLAQWGRLMEQGIDISSLDFVVGDIELKDISIQSKKGSREVDVAIGKIDTPKPLPVFDKLSMTGKWDGKSKITTAFSLPALGFNFTSLVLENKSTVDAGNHTSLAGVLETGGGELAFELTNHLSLSVKQLSKSPIELDEFEPFKWFEDIELSGRVKDSSFTLTREMPLQKMAWIAEGVFFSDDLTIVLSGDKEPVFAGDLSGSGEGVDFEYSFDERIWIFNQGKVTLAAPVLELQGYSFNDYHLNMEVTEFADVVTFDSAIKTEENKSIQIAKGELSQRAESFNGKFRFGLNGPMMVRALDFWGADVEPEFSGLVYGEINFEESYDEDDEVPFSLVFDELRIDTGNPISGRIVGRYHASDLVSFDELDLVCGDVKVVGKALYLVEEDGYQFDGLTMLREGKPCGSINGFFPFDYDAETIALRLSFDEANSHYVSRFFSSDFNTQATVTGDFEVGGSSEAPVFEGELDVVFVGDGKQTLDKRSEMLEEFMEYYPLVDMWINLPYEGSIEMRLAEDQEWGIQSDGSFSVGGIEFESLRANLDSRFADELDVDVRLVQNADTSINGLVRVDFDRGDIKHNMRSQGEVKSMDKLRARIKKMPYARSMDSDLRKSVFKFLDGL